MAKGIKKKKIYGYENSDGDKGIIIACTEREARKLFKKEYPERKIVDDDDDYYDDGAYLYEVVDLEDESALYCVFEG